MTGFPSRRGRLALVAGLTAASALAAWLTTPRRVPQAALAPRGAIVLALAGDLAISDALDARSLDDASRPLAPADRSLAVGNLAVPMRAALDQPAPGEAHRQPDGVADGIPALARLGIGAVSLANDHVMDAGPDGLALLQGRLAAEGIAYAGAGANLDRARAPVYVTTRDGVVALVGVTVSGSAAARAAARQGDILGRPGVNRLRHERRVVVDATRFAALVRAFPPPALSARADGRTWDLMGLTIERGAEGGMRLAADPGDLEALAASVREARARAAAVVVSLHAHEPGNGADDVSDLARTVAHAAIEAGADVVHGHGPHRLRGIEVYQGRPIFYSLGTYLLPERAMTSGAFDVAQDAAPGILSSIEPGAPALDLDDDAWWQSAAAIVRITRGRVDAVELRPIDLGMRRARGTRGIPIDASARAAAAILERIHALSARLGTRITVHGETATVELDRSGPRTTSAR
ncbi:MAG: CapA family protein [Vicinamibacterales bacterium]